MEEENKISLRSVLVILLSIVIIIAVIQTITILSSLSSITEGLESAEGSVDGKVRLYVMPKPVSEEAQVKLNVINKGGGN